MSELTEMGEDLSNSEIAASTLVPIRLYNRKSSKFFKLINNTSETTVKLNKQPYSLGFRSLIYIESIAIELKDEKNNSFVIKGIRDGKEVIEVKLECKDGKGRAYMDVMLDGLVLEPTTRILRQPVKSIRLYGFQDFKFEALEKEIYDATLLRNKFEELYGSKIKEIGASELALEEKIKESGIELESINEGITEKSKESEELDTLVAKSKQQQDSLIRDIANKKDQLSSIERKYDDLSEKIRVLVQTRVILRKISKIGRRNSWI